jgi:hypothetical protein
MRGGGPKICCSSILCSIGVLGIESSVLRYEREMSHGGFVIFQFAVNTDRSYKLPPPVKIERTQVPMLVQTARSLTYPVLFYIPGEQDVCGLRAHAVSVQEQSSWLNGLYFGKLNGQYRQFCGASRRRTNRAKTIRRTKNS